jgi:hypothetical protein
LSSARENENPQRYNSVDSLVVGYSPGSNDVSSIETEEFPLLDDVARKRPVKIQQARKGSPGAVIGNVVPVLN